MTRRNYASILLVPVALVAGLFAGASRAQAWTTSPSGSDRTEPIDITVTQSDFNSACSGWASVQIRFDGQTVGYGSMLDWVDADGVNDITWNDITLADGFGLEYTGHPTSTTEVAAIYVVCNALADYDYNWDPKSNADTGWNWTVGEEEATSTEATTTTEISDTELGAYAIVIFLVSALVSFVLIAI